MNRTPVLLGISAAVLFFGACSDSNGGPDGGAENDGGGGLDGGGGNDGGGGLDGGSGNDGSASGICANGTVEPGEACDGSNLVNATCTSLGFTGGTLACSTSCQFDVSSCTGGTITPSVTPSRTSCSAPCSVFFDATATTGLAGSVVGSAGVVTGDYVQANWTWDFNDPTSPHKGTIGFVAAHVFDNPGTYDVKTRVQDIAGNAGSTTTTITVSAMSGTVYYVAATGNDSNNGTSTSTPFQTYAHAIALAGTNTTIKFRNGDTFSVPSGGNIIAATGPFLVTGYNDPGSPSVVAPILDSTDTSAFTTVFIMNAGSDIRFTDVHVISHGGFQIFNIAGSPNALFERVETEGYTQSAGGQAYGLSANETGVTVNDCYDHSFVGYGIFALT